MAAFRPRLDTGVKLTEIGSRLSNTPLELTKPNDARARDNFVWARARGFLVKLGLCEELG